ncbi:MAG: sugar transferase, partial [Hyphomicrobiales bacterium]
MKRTADLVVSAAILVVLSPLLLAVALAILLIDRQFPFYLDERMGQHVRKFRCWKFRTMRNDDAKLAAYLLENPEEAARYAATRKLNRDPRTTRLGAFLRRTSIDELPQLINVLKGEMSLVGPRPIT